ncbi:MAG: hypothetical protein J2P25_07210 [Nocardiopsaceae bacterium]|nr:hypothetical protein [Nocardiopsaceae bacterium]
MLRLAGNEVRPAHRGELRVIIAAARPGPGQVRGYLTADLIRRYTERIGLAPTVIDFSPGNADELRATCDALNIHPPRHTLVLPLGRGQFDGLFPDGVRAPVFDVGVRGDGAPLPDGADGLAGYWLQATPMGEGSMSEGGRGGDGMALGEEPLSVRMEMLGLDGDPAATLSRWRRRVAEWARSPSGAMSRPHAEAIGAAIEDGLDTAAALRVLADLEADDAVPDGVKFETFAAADRMFGLDLARDVGR